MLDDAMQVYRRGGLWAVIRRAGHFVISDLLFGRRRRRQREQLEEQDAFDARYGTDTTSLVDRDRLDLPPESRRQAVLYWPSLQRTLDRIFAAVDVDHAAFTFIDLGSGKGRVLFAAAFYPFRRIIGVEMSRPLHEIAERNVAVFRAEAQRCRDIQLLCQDAGLFEFPDGNLVLYMFDPFDAPVVERVMGNLRASLAQRDREVWLAYLRPRNGEVVLRSGLFEVVAGAERIGPTFMTVEYDWRVYRHRPAAG